MRTRFAVLALVLAAVVSGCGSSSKPAAAGDSSSPAAPSDTPSITVPAGGSFDCARYAQTSAQISKAASQMFAGSVADFQKATDALKAEFSALKDGAPGNVAHAVDNLESALTEIARIRANPTSADQSHLQQLAQSLPADGRTITAYIASKCG